MLVVDQILLTEAPGNMAGNDNGHGRDKKASAPPGPGLRDEEFDEMSLSGGSFAVALGITALDAAHSLSLAMQNAVVEQQHGWTMQRIVMTRAMDQLLRSDVGVRAVDTILGKSNRADPPAH